MDWREAVQRTVAALGYDVVDVERSAGGLLRVYIDRLPGRRYETGEGEAVTVDDCELVTRQLQYALPVDGIDYERLEVSSPGLDRPLRRPEDWQRFAGSEVDLTLRQPLQGRKRWRGTLASRDGDGWRLLLSEPDSGPPARPAVRSAPRRVASPRGIETNAVAEVQVLDFELADVREARLVPQVDFKGRRGTPRPAAR